jgi:arylsulfatase
MDAHSPYRICDRYNRWGGEDIYDVQSRAQPNYLQFIDDGGYWWELQALESLYDGAIRQLDDALETLIEALSSTGQLGNTLLVITADHGENFGERSFTRPNTRLAGHTAGIDENLLHVPLICSFPQEQGSGITVDEPVSLVTFPSVVRECISDSVNADVFCSQRPIVAYSVRESAPGPDNERYVGTARAVYENADSRGVNKYCEWGSSTQQVHIDDAQTAYPFQSEGIDVQTVFDSFDQVDISKQGKDEPTEESIERRLRHLGYLE